MSSPYLIVDKDGQVIAVDQFQFLSKRQVASNEQQILHALAKVQADLKTIREALNDTTKGSE